MQMHKIMAPVFARLGVKLVTRNLSQGGLGTLQNSMAAGDLYGQESTSFLNVNLLLLAYPMMFHVWELQYALLRKPVVSPLFYLHVGPLL